MRNIFIFLTFTLFCQNNQPQTAETEIEIHGFLSRGYIKSSKYNYLADDSTSGTSKFGEFGINFGYQAHDRLRLSAQILARELGSAGEYNPNLDWAFLDYQLANWASLKYGKFFTPGGLYNEGRDADFLRNRIFLSHTIYSPNFRDLSTMSGLQLHGNIEIGENNSIDYTFSKGNVSFNDNSTFLVDFQFGVKKILKINTNTKGNIDNLISYSFIWNTWIEGLRLGFTQADISINIDATITPFGVKLASVLYDNSEVFKIHSIEYTRDNWRYTFERITGRMDRVGFGPTQVHFNLQSYYHQITYRLNDRYEFGILKSTAHENTLAGKNAIDQYQKDLTFTIRQDLSDSWVLKFEYHDMQGIGSFRDIFNPTTNATSNRGKNWDMFMTKITYSF
ncbi:MAG: hypothetical protein COB02_01605 [Candidatus Cloacimonadota bacterium]|nr:MAG: hypothetical protein COB02_01605 [Candidatus Cloacimonadota bacterium]